MDERWVALGSEGGHVSFAPANTLERDIHAAVERQYGHVSAERLLSGAGLEFIYKFLADTTPPRSAANITKPINVKEFLSVVEKFARRFRG